MDHGGIIKFECNCCSPEMNPISQNSIFLYCGLVHIFWLLKTDLSLLDWKNRGTGLEFLDWSKNNPNESIFQNGLRGRWEKQNILKNSRKLFLIDQIILQFENILTFFSQIGNFLFFSSPGLDLLTLCICHCILYSCHSSTLWTFEYEKIKL